LFQVGAMVLSLILIPYLFGLGAIVAIAAGLISTGCSAVNTGFNNINFSGFGGSGFGFDTNFSGRRLAQWVIITDTASCESAASTIFIVGIFMILHGIVDLVQ